MNRYVTTAGFAVVLAMSLAAAASAATLSGVSGSVLVDSGKGFTKMSASGEVPAGSRILVSKAGKAVLAYADGCSKALGPNTITTVVGSGACKSVTQVAGQDNDKKNDLTPFFIAGGVGVGAGLIGYAIGNGSGNDEVVFVPISR